MGYKLFSEMSQNWSCGCHGNGAIKLPNIEYDGHKTTVKINKNDPPVVLLVDSEIQTCQN